ncbi:MAG: hypothetical protein AAFP03_16075, partial [Cyanobacteria bacterium J06598_3]
DDGQNSQAAVCRAIPEVKGFPTWAVNGQFLEGSQTLEALATASNYDGPTNFLNSGGTGATSQGG